MKGNEAVAWLVTAAVVGVVLYEAVVLRGARDGLWALAALLHALAQVALSGEPRGIVVGWSSGRIHQPSRSPYLRTIISR